MEASSLSTPTRAPPKTRQASRLDGITHQINPPNKFPTINTSPQNATRVFGKLASTADAAPHAVVTRPREARGDVKEALFFAPKLFVGAPSNAWGKVNQTLGPGQGPG